jgi:glycosyltransferase involved in cell wall biosynthesis
VAERDPAALAAAVGRMLDDPDLRARVGGEARRTVLARHGWDRVAHRLETAYEAAANRPRASRRP